jgi:hypothetical protein
LKYVDVYRYPPASVFLYNDLLQQILAKHSWPIETDRVSTAIQMDDQELNYADFDDIGRDKEPCPIKDYIEGYFNLQHAKGPKFKMHMNNSIIVFHVLNQALRECCFSPQLEQAIFDYTKIFMAQPLPKSLVPLETNRIIKNERLIPGLTKVLQIAHDFPALNIPPDAETLQDSRKMNIIHQVSQVFVYED